jgi:pyrimidine operon attenuation protein/uracil phosphoribosyltransferase
MQLPGGPGYRVVYSTESAPNAVTGKRVTLVVDRYYLGRGNRRAIVDLGTPQGVDNVDAYRLMIESFRWR